jgi:regulatory protein
MAFARIEREAPSKGFEVSCAGAFPFIVSRELFVRLALHLGQELTEAEYHELRELQRQHECKVQGLRYLAMREHTRFELVQKLLKKRFEQRTIVVVLDQLIAENLLSEYRYARLFIEGRLRRKVEGRAMMARRLSAKQVNHGDAQRALDELYTEEMTALYVRRAYQGTIAKVGEQNIRYALQKIGFSAYEIRLALEEWGGEDA